LAERWGCSPETVRQLVKGAVRKWQMFRVCPRTRGLHRFTEPKRVSQINGQLLQIHSHLREKRA